jgi:hypothetical protein
MRDAPAGKCYETFVIYRPGSLRGLNKPGDFEKGLRKPSAGRCCDMKTPVSDQRGSIASY